MIDTQFITGIIIGASAVIIAISWYPHLQKNFTDISVDTSKNLDQKTDVNIVSETLQNTSQQNIQNTSELAFKNDPDVVSFVRDFNFLEVPTAGTDSLANVESLREFIKMKISTLDTMLSCFINFYDKGFLHFTREKDNIIFLKTQIVDLFTNNDFNILLEIFSEGLPYLAAPALLYTLWEYSINCNKLTMDQMIKFSNLNFLISKFERTRSDNIVLLRMFGSFGVSHKRVIINSNDDKSKTTLLNIMKKRELELTNKLNRKSLSQIKDFTLKDQFPIINKQQRSK